MKKLIAARPIMYMGRTYAPGDAVPAYDEKLVGAWLSAGSAAWTGAEETAPEPAGADTEAVQAADALGAMGVSVAAAAQAVRALQVMGVSVTDDTGNFVGAEILAEQIRNAFSVSAESGQQAAADQDGAQAQEAGDDQSDAESGQEAAGAPEMVTGHMDAAQLEKTMTRDQLNQMATEMKLDISACRNKGAVAALIAAQTVQAPREETEGAQ